MNPITLFISTVLVLAGVGLGFLGLPVLAALFVLVALLVAASLKMANTWQKFVILRAGNPVRTYCSYAIAIA